MSVLHVVLFRPRTDLGADEERALLEAIAHAARSIPGIRRFRIGRRLADGPQYGAQAGHDFPFCAMVEVDDVAGLLAYLADEAHVQLGACFRSALADALVCDFEMTDGADAPKWLAR